MSHPRQAPRKRILAGDAGRWLGLSVMVFAGLVYSLHLWRALDASEAYTALAAGQPSYPAVVRVALRFDPGKPPLYQVLLHSLGAIFGFSEPVLRTPSVIFSMLNVGLLIEVGSEMFEPSIGIAAAALWALSPLAIIFGGWARMYAMLIALSLGQFLLMWKIRSRAGAGLVVACGLLGAAMLYTHLGSALFLGAEAAMLVGAARRGQSTRAGWLALLISLTLFLPFIPTASSQVRDLITGHWVDWIGQAHHITPGHQIVSILAAIAICAGLTFIASPESDEREPMQWCLAVGLMPIVALAAGSIAIRPMFATRYVSPSLALMLLLAVRGLAVFGQRAMSLSVTAIATVLLCLLPYYPWYEPWRDIAKAIAAAPADEPVFFEPNFTDSQDPGAHPQEGFPQGFLRVAFDRYFSGGNPRRVVDPSSPAEARQTIAGAAAAANGAWLITGFGPERAHEELPDRCFSVEMKVTCQYAHLYHVVPLGGCVKHRP